MKRCARFVSWWDGEYEGECELPEGHGGPHFDGLSWYDDDMNEQEQRMSYETVLVGDLYLHDRDEYREILLSDGEDESIYIPYSGLGELIGHLTRIKRRADETDHS